MKTTWCNHTPKVLLWQEVKKLLPWHLYCPTRPPCSWLPRVTEKAYRWNMKLLNVATFHSALDRWEISIAISKFQVASHSNVVIQPEVSVAQKLGSNLHLNWPACDISSWEPRVPANSASMYAHWSWLDRPKFLWMLYCCWVCRLIPNVHGRYSYLQFRGVLFLEH